MIKMNFGESVFDIVVKCDLINKVLWNKRSSD